MKNRKLILSILGIAIVLLSVIGVTYAYFSAKITENNKTETVIKSNELGLIYTGINEINCSNIVPGDSCTKTFSVENTSNRAVDFNVYMQNITNEFNEDLVYTLSDEDGEVVSETALPVTNTEKSYLKTALTIDTGVTKNYTLKIEYKYLDTPQNDYQGKTFKATVGIDTEQIQEGIVTYYAFGLPDSSSTTDYTTLGKKVFVSLKEEQLSVCILKNNKLECFKINNWDEEQNHIQEVFSDVSCNSDGSYVSCNDNEFGCYISSGGNVQCSADSPYTYCSIGSDGLVGVDG